MKEDLETLAPYKDNLQEVGEELLSLIGESDKPEVERSIEDVDLLWKALNDACMARLQSLEAALLQAGNFQEDLMVWIQFIFSIFFYETSWLPEYLLK